MKVFITKQFFDIIKTQKEILDYQNAHKINEDDLLEFVEIDTELENTLFGYQNIINQASSYPVQLGDNDIYISISYGLGNFNVKTPKKEIKRENLRMKLRNQITNNKVNVSSENEIQTNFVLLFYMQIQNKNKIACNFSTSLPVPYKYAKLAMESKLDFFTIINQVTTDDICVFLGNIETKCVLEQCFKVCYKSFVE